MPARLRGPSHLLLAALCWLISADRLAAEDGQSALLENPTTFRATGEGLVAEGQVSLFRATGDRLVATHVRSEFSATGPMLTATGKQETFRATGPALIALKVIQDFKVTGPELTAVKRSFDFRATGDPLTAIARSETFQATGPGLSAVSASTAFRATGPTLFVAGTHSDFRATGPLLTAFDKNADAPADIGTGEDVAAGASPCPTLLMCKTPEELDLAAQAISLTTDLSPGDPDFCNLVEDLVGSCNAMAATGEKTGENDGAGPPPPSRPQEDTSDVNMARCRPFESHVLEMNRRSLNGEDITQQEEAVQRAILLAMPVMLQGDLRVWCETLMGHLRP